ncbi:MAG: FAD-dependent oxidoreductase [Nitrospira sp.]|nr:FAD-dependent oxidoreductase [Nitrospira sp.]
MAEPTQTAKVLSVTDLTPNVRQLIALPKTQKLSFQPGQWVSLKLPVGAKQPLNRAYSLATPESPSGELTLVFDRVAQGAGSGYLYRLRAGDEVSVSGPYGSFVLPKLLDRELLFVTYYTGLVPVRCIVKALHAHRETPPVLTIAVGPAEDELLYHQELLSLAVMRASFRYLPLVASSEESAVALTISMLRPLIEGKSKVIPMLCGRRGFVHPLRSWFMEAGYDRKEVKTETYD